MKDIEEIQKRFLRWFQSLPLESNQKTAKLVSRILKQMQGSKDKKGNQCSWSPCHRHEYARGLCNTHYGQVGLLRRLTREKWDTFYQIGLCRPSNREISLAYEYQEPNPKDPLKILLRKHY